MAMDLTKASNRKMPLKKSLFEPMASMTKMASQFLTLLFFCGVLKADKGITEPTNMASPQNVSIPPFGVGEEGETLLKLQERNGPQNGFDRPHFFACSSGQSLYRIKSTHSNKKEDRTWEWICRPNAALAGHSRCKWSNYVNNFDGTLRYSCPENYPIIAGTRSYHDNRREDRRFKYRCCHGNTSCRRTRCSWSGWINQWDGKMDYYPPHGRTIVGFYSVHKNRREDRRWKARICIMAC